MGLTPVIGGAGFYNKGAGGAVTPAGNNAEIQFNNAGAFGASAAFTFNNGVLNVGTAGTAGSIDIASDGTATQPHLEFANIAGGAVRLTPAATLTTGTITIPVVTGNMVVDSVANVFTALQTITQATTNSGIVASTGYSLTGANAQSMIDLAGTWNTSAQVTLIKANVTNTASGAGSKLLDLQIGGVSKGSIDTNGTLQVTEVDYVNSNLAHYNNSNVLTSWNSGNIFGAATTGLKIKSDKTLGWSDGDMGGTTDTTASRLAAAVIGVSGLAAGSIQALSGPGAVNLTTLTTEITSTGVLEALTLANGVAGQFKTITHGVDGGSAVLTPTTKTGFTEITFANAGDAVTLQYFTTRGWVIVGIFGAVAA